MIDRFITYSKTASWILKFSLTFLFYVFFTIVTVTPLRWQTYPCIPRHTCSGQQQCTARGRGSCGGKVGQCTGSAVQTHCLLFHWGCSAATSAVSVWRIRPWMWMHVCMSVWSDLHRLGVLAYIGQAVFVCEMEKMGGKSKATLLLYCQLTFVRVGGPQEWGYDSRVRGGQVGTHLVQRVPHSAQLQQDTRVAADAMCVHCLENTAGTLAGHLQQIFLCTQHWSAMAQLSLFILWHTLGRGSLNSMRGVLLSINIFYHIFLLTFICIITQ